MSCRTRYFSWDGAAVRHDVHNGGRRVQDLGQVRHTADLHEPIAAPKPCPDLYDIDRLRRVAEFEARLEDPAVCLGLEVFGPQEIAHSVERERIDHDRREDGRLCVEIVRRHPTIHREWALHRLHATRRQHLLHLQMQAATFTAVAVSRAQTTA
jgi:hypothetical protein